MMKFSDIKDAIESMDYEVRSYSGRGMYGKQCLGVETSLPATQFLLGLVGTFCENANNVDNVDDVADFVETLIHVSTDNMGRDTIVYWPSIDDVLEQAFAALDELETKLVNVEQTTDDEMSKSNWTVREHDLRDSTYSLAEVTLEGEAEARTLFEQGREHARVYGGAAELKLNGELIESYSFYVV